MVPMAANVTASPSGSGSPTGSVPTNTTSGPTPFAELGAVSLIWVPYVALTLILLGLLVASFVHFHYKYRDRYIKRSQIARNGSDIDLPDLLESNMLESIYNGSYVNHTMAVSTTDLRRDSSTAGASSVRMGAMVGTTPSVARAGSRTKTTRLKMLYGNKVDVDNVVRTSMFERSRSYDQDLTTFGKRKGSITSLHSDRDDLDYMKDSRHPWDLSKPRDRDVDTVGRGGLSMDETSTRSARSTKSDSSGARRGVSVSIWSTGAHKKKYGKT